MALRIAPAYDRYVLGHPRVVLGLLLLSIVFFAYHARSFQLDASADSLLLEDDEDLRIFREVQARYPSKELLVVTFTPDEDLFTDRSLARLGDLRDELKEVPGVDSVLTLLDVPLLKNRDLSLVEAVQNFTRLEEPGVDKARAREEILASPIYRDLLLGADARTTALLIELEEDEEYARLLEAREELRAKRRSGELGDAERERLERVSAAYDQRHRLLNERRHEIVQRVRAAMAPYEAHGVLHLGGVPMITDDMISFVRSDLVVFGSSVLLFLVIVLTLIFRSVRWVVLPLGSCFYAGLVMVGLLGLIGWKVTVISSNFLALMLILTISMNIHLIVRYRQLRRDFPGSGQRELVAATVAKMARPCLYTALTSIIGFGSLVVSDIKPVIDFGWMMSTGLVVTFLTSFLLFPAVLVSLERTAADAASDEARLPRRLAGATAAHGGKVLALAVVLALASGAGMSRLKVENSFINYFSEDTEIYQGLKLIDRKLGGTTPLEVIIKFENEFAFEEPAEDEELTEEDLEFLEMERQLAEEYASSPEYWFTPYKVERIKEVHDYLAGLPEVGKVLSLASVVRVGEDLTESGEFDAFQLALLYKKIPEDMKRELIDPYVSVEHSEARILLRIIDSREDLRRQELLQRIRRDLTTELGFEEDEVVVTGLLVMYNNMLQSLFRSQISTLGVVMVGIGIMFLILFRSFSLSVIGIVPNMLGAAVVLGVMGWLDIPLDMMTITIAAITIGIAVDNGIHYIYRFREEFARSGDYEETMYLCHLNIGKAMLYTTTTIIFGFSILVLSNFIPTVYFGVLTALAMLIALLAALTVLPKLILVWRPFRAIAGSEVVALRQEP